MVMGTSVLVALGGWYAAYVLYIKKPHLPLEISSSLLPFYNVLYNKYWIDELYSKVFVQPVLKFSDKVVLAFLDKQIIEGVVNGLPNLVGAFSRKLRQIQTGLLSNYGLVMAAGALFIIGYMVFLR